MFSVRMRKLLLRATKVLLVTLPLSGCIWIPPPKVETTTPLSKSPRIVYDGLFVHALVDSTGTDPNPKLCRMIMAETIKKIALAHTFQYIAVEDTSVLAAATVREVPRDALISPDSLPHIARNIAECTITLREYDKGDSVNRFLVGLLYGGGAVGLDMQLVDRRYGHVIVAGKARKTIQGMYASEYDVAKPLADAVALFFHLQLRQLVNQAVQRLGERESGD